MNIIIRIVCMCVIFIPYKFYYEDKHHHSMPIGMTFIVALVSISVAYGVMFLINKAKGKKDGPPNNSF